MQFEIFFKDIASAMPSFSRDIEEAHKEGIRGIWCKTKFEFVIFNSGGLLKLNQAILNIIRKRLIQFQFYR
jgi:hypothetical protein